MSKSFLLLPSLFILWVFMGCSESPQQGRPSSGAAGSAFPVRGLIIEAQPIAKTYTATGTCNPNESVTLRAERAGRIERLLFKEGDWVRKGQLLVTINAKELTARKQVLESELSLSEKKLERAKKLVNLDAISEEELEELQFGYDNLLAQIAELEATLDKAMIRAPFSGKLGFRQISPGAFVNVGEVIVELVNADPLKITFPVPEKYMGIVSVGDTVEVNIRNQQSISLPIAEVSPTVDPGNRSFTARVFLNNKEGRILPGTFAEIKMTVYNSQESALVPSDAVIQKLGGEELYVVRNNKASRQQIHTGTRNENFVEVLEGVGLGDTVIISGILSLKNGIPVKASIADYEMLRQ